MAQQDQGVGHGFSLRPPHPPNDPPNDPPKQPPKDPPKDLSKVQEEASASRANRRESPCRS
ncbi:hypothetical protein GCM10009840_00670 [Pseudolysinimonas kribbensis]